MQPGGSSSSSFPGKAGRAQTTPLDKASSFQTAEVQQDEFQPSGWDLNFAIFSLQVVAKSPEDYPD